MTHTKVRVEHRGRHVWLTFFSSPGDTHDYAQNGVLILSESEWEDWKLGLLNMDEISRISGGTVRVTIEEEVT